MRFLALFEGSGRWRTGRTASRCIVKNHFEILVAFKFSAQLYRFRIISHVAVIERNKLYAYRHMFTTFSKNSDPFNSVYTIISMASCVRVCRSELF